MKKRKNVKVGKARHELARLILNDHHMMYDGEGTQDPNMDPQQAPVTEPQEPMPGEEPQAPAPEQAPDQA